MTRATIYKWKDPEIPYSEISRNSAIAFILRCETDPRMLMLFARGPTKYKKGTRVLVKKLAKQEDKT